MEKDFTIDEFGQIHRDTNKKPETNEEKLYNEYSLLSYEIHHATRPTKDPEKIARYQELKQILKIDDNASANAFNKAKEKIRTMAAAKHTNNNALAAAIAQRKKENE